MNKKIFAALASATMALSATGSLAVFAEDFDVVTEAKGNNGAGSGLVVANGKVTLDGDNFPDTGFLKDLIAAFPGSSYGSEVKVSDLKNLNINNSAKDLAGIEVFTKLETITSTNASSLVTADLSKNTSLKAVSLIGAQSLATLDLPEGKNLQVVIVTGDPVKKAPITEIDLSGNKFLSTVAIENTNVAKIDLSNNVYLVQADLSNNDLNTIDITNCASLETLNVSNNELYGIELPTNKVLTELYADNNLLQELDVTPVPALEVLTAEHNELRDFDLTDNKNLTQIRLGWNHIGALDIPKVNFTALDANGWDTADTAKSNINPQFVYVDSAYNAINLEENFANIDADLVVADDADSFDKKTTQLTLDGDSTHYLYRSYASAPTGWGANVYVVKANVLNRLYNPNSGEHFYTKDIKEKDALVELGWVDEGIGWVSPMEKYSAEPVYRLYNPNAGDHHYTKNAYERDTLVTVGWKYEGVGWYSYNPDKISMSVAGYAINPVNVLREYNPNAKAAGSHNYTINPAENDFLVSVGWLDEGVAWGSLK